MVFSKFQMQAAFSGNLQSRLDCPGVFAEKIDHFFCRLKVKLVCFVSECHIIRNICAARLRYIQHDIMRNSVFPFYIMTIVRRNEFDAEVFCYLRYFCKQNFFMFEAVILDLQIKVFAEYFFVQRCVLDRFIHVPVYNLRIDDARRTCRHCN